MFGLLGRSLRSSRLPLPRRPGRRPRLHVEELETRTLLSAFTPTQILHAYGFDRVAFTNAAGQTVRGDGSGQTIAIVDAYHDPYLASDVHYFDSHYGLPDAPKLTVVQPQGGSGQNANWALEETMDVEWAHAVAPKANILVVETKSNNMADLLGGVDYARKQAGVTVISMSWGSAEWSGQLAYDAVLGTPVGHVGGSGMAGGITFVAATGDGGAGVEYPSTSTHVLAVGGTTLQLDAAGNYLGETAWNLSSGGYSQFETRPGYQVGFQTSGFRTNPDVSMISNWNSGVSIYNTLGGGWEMAGGTSLGAPLWAGLIALADQGRNLQGLASLYGPSQTVPAIYKLPSSDFHDVTSGSTGYAAKAGYDLTTGRGSPYADRVIAGLVNTAVTATPTGTTSGTRTTTTKATTSAARPHGEGQPVAAPASVLAVSAIPLSPPATTAALPVLGGVVTVGQNRPAAAALPGLPALIPDTRIESGGDQRAAMSFNAQDDDAPAPSAAPSADPDTQDSGTPNTPQMPTPASVEETFSQGEWVEPVFAPSALAAPATTDEVEATPRRTAAAVALALVLGGTWHVRSLRTESDARRRRI